MRPSDPLAPLPGGEGEGEGGLRAPPLAIVWRFPPRGEGAYLEADPPSQAEATVPPTPPEARHAASARSAMARVSPAKIRPWTGQSAYQ